MAHIPERRKTMRRKDEEALRKSEEKYRTILESIEEGYCEVDLAGNFIFFNDSTCRIFGYSREELMGMNGRQYTDKDNARKLYQGFNKIYRTGLPGYIVDYEIISKDGTKRYMETSASLLKDLSGKAIGFRAVIRDVTERKKSQEALGKSEEKYRVLLDNASDAILQTNEEGNLLEVNKKTEELLGYKRKELLGVNIAKIHPPEELEKIINGFQEIKTKGLGAVNNTAVLRKDGKTVSVDISGSVIEYSGQKVIQGIFRDITERKNMEEALDKSEERYRTILESIDDGYYEIDLAGNYTFANDAEERIMGYAKQELLGMNFRQYLDETNLKKANHIFLEHYRTRQPIEAMEMEVIKKDGTKAIHETSVSLIVNSEGKRIGFRGITRDITKRRQMEDALRQSEERYRTILEDIEEGYFEIDLVGNFIFLNESMFRIFGYPKEELIGMNYKHYTDKENGKKCFQVYNKIYRTGEPGKVYDYEIIRKDGTKKYIESYVSLERDSSGSPVGFRGINRDITERKRAEDTLRKNQEELIQKNLEIEESRKNVQLTLEKLGAAYEELKTTQSKIIQQEKMASIGQLAAGVAHEINNPMAFIASNLGTLNKYIRRLKEFIEAQSEAIKSLKATDAIEKLGKKRKELKLDYTIGDIDLLVKESLEGSERVQKIVQGLNRFSRVDDEEYKDININECIESSINIVWSELKLKATLHKDYGNLPHTKCYPLKLSQVFINLLVNATQAIEKKGKIEIKTWEKDGSIWITVSDTGYGISKENQSKIFEPFFTTKEAGKGTGLGLSISYDIIQRHKGEISFKSEKRKGTTFTIKIPII